ncbi:MAG: integrase family protein [Microvirga sp.]|nr:integrase family protein [Microvirga sp.]
MGGLANLVLRGRVFYFRRRVPADLRERLGRRELVRSLGTIDQRAARSNACWLYLASEGLFTGLRATPMLTDTELSRLVQDFYASVLRGDDAVRLVRAEPLPSHLVAAKRDFYGKVAARAREALAGDGFGEAREIAASLLRRQGIATATFGVAEWNQVRQAVLKAGIDVAEAMQARCAGDFEHEPKDRRLKMALASLASELAPAPASVAPAAAPSTSTSEHVPAEAAMSKPLSELWPAFCEQQTVSGAWEGQTASQARATFRLFIDVCGNKSLAAYTRGDASRFKQQAERLPALYAKSPRYRDKSVAEIIALYAEDTGTTRGKPLTAKTIKRHFSALSTFWEEAEASGDVAGNIFKGFRFGAAKKATEQRQMWEKAELARLFATPIWTGCLSEQRRTAPGSLILRDEKFWLPLIAVFSGLRQEEICQLHVADVQQSEGIWFFDINDKGARKLKNRSAARRVPVHAELIRLGLLDEVAARRRAGEARLFPQLEGGGADGRLGHAYAKAFTRYRQDVSLYRSGLDFHSFRHSATTFMHQAGIHATVVDHVTGHVTAGETARYTKRSSLQQMQQAIDAIAIDVDLSALHRPPG